MKIRVAGIKKESLIDGPGISFVIFTQGCLQNCPGCHNPESQPLDGGRELSLKELIEDISSASGVDTIVFSGGEPFLQAGVLGALGGWAQENDFRVVTYSGYTFEYLMDEARKNEEYAELLKVTDILIDGAYKEEEKDVNLPYRGSKNQRVLDAKLSWQQDKAVPCEKWDHIGN